MKIFAIVGGESGIGTNCRATWQRSHVEPDDHQPRKIKHFLLIIRKDLLQIGGTELVPRAGWQTGLANNPGPDPAAFLFCRGAGGLVGFGFVYQCAPAGGSALENVLKD